MVGNVDAAILVLLRIPIPEGFEVPVFLVVVGITIVQLVRHRPAVAAEGRDDGREVLFFGACLALVGLGLTVATVWVDGSVGAYLIALSAVVTGAVLVWRSAKASQ